MWPSLYNILDPPLDVFPLNPVGLCWWTWERSLTSCGHPCWVRSLLGSYHWKIEKRNLWTRGNSHVAWMGSSWAHCHPKSYWPLSQLRDTCSANWNPTVWNRKSGLNHEVIVGTRLIWDPCCESTSLWWAFWHYWVPGRKVWSLASIKGSKTRPP